MALQTDAWSSDLQEKLTERADFISRMTDYSEFINNGYIHVPQAGSVGTVTKNANSFPLPIGQRTDSELLIKIDQYSTNPIVVTDIEQHALSYNKRQSIMGAQNDLLIESIGNSIFQAVAPSDAGRVVTSAGKLKYTDVLAIQKILDKDMVPAAERFLELPVDLFYELLEDEAVQKQYISGLNTVQTGTFVELAGIKIFKRPTVATVNGAAAGVAYQRGFVAVGMGGVMTFIDAGSNGNGKPEYNGGVVMNNAVWMGAGKLRTDGKGIVSLVRGA